MGKGSERESALQMAGPTQGHLLSQGARSDRGEQGLHHRRNLRIPGAETNYRRGPQIIVFKSKGKHVPRRHITSSSGRWISGQH